MRPKHHRARRAPAPPAGRVPPLAAHPAMELSEDRLRALRARVREGVYDVEEVAGAVARRILARGDL